MTDPRADQICAHCGADIDFEEIIWLDPDGEIVIESGAGGDPYHEECLP